MHTRYVLVTTFGRGGRDRPRSGGKNNNFLFYFLLLCHRKIYQPFSFSSAMAKRKSRGMKIQPAVTDLLFKNEDAADPGTALSTMYVDTFRELSKVNRRLYAQGRMLAYQGLTFIWRPNSAGNAATIEVTIKTAGNSWIVQNAHTKGEALWHEMNKLVLDDNPSIEGKWADFKVRLTKDQLLPITLEARDGNGDVYVAGEWNYSDYVMPQHEVDPATGLPLAAEIFAGCLIGPNGGSIKSLALAYQESRATVQADMPNVPAGVSTSFFNLLTDSGSQEPELADVIIDENDNPPYDIDNYPGTTGNAPVPVTVQYGAVSAQEVDGRVGAFVAPCGLLQIDIAAYSADGTPVPVPMIDMLLHVSPGTYKGVASIPMGQ